MYSRQGRLYWLARTQLGHREGTSDSITQEELRGDTVKDLLHGTGPCLHCTNTWDNGTGYAVDQLVHFVRALYSQYS